LDAEAQEREKSGDIAFNTFVVGTVHEYAEQWDKAITAYRAALRFDNDAAIHDAIVRCALGKQDQVTAILHLREALAVGNDTTRRRRLLAEAYMAAGQPDSALPLFERVLETEHDERLLHTTAGLLMRQRNFHRAAAIYDSLRRFHPENTGYSLLLAEAYMNDGDWERASDLLFPLASDTSIGHEDRMQIGKLYFQKSLQERSDVVRAMSVFDTLHAHFPTDWRPLWFRGALLFNEGATDEAIASFESVLRLTPDNREAVSILVRALISRDRYKQAVDILEQVVVDGKANAETWSLLGHVYNVLGDQPRAKRALEEALRLDPSNDALRSTLDEMNHHE
jgi:tetratricopeptide (TPR) repeat protein